jgi:hypothetical protein
MSANGRLPGCYPDNVGSNPTVSATFRVDPNLPRDTVYYYINPDRVYHAYTWRGEPVDSIEFQALEELSKVPINLTTLRTCLDIYILPPAGLKDTIKVGRTTSGELALYFGNTGNRIVSEHEIATLCPDPKKTVTFLQEAVAREKVIQDGSLAGTYAGLSRATASMWSTTTLPPSPSPIEEKAKAAITSPLEAKLDKVLSRLDDLEATMEALQEMVEGLEK